MFALSSSTSHRPGEGRELVYDALVAIFFKFMPVQKSLQGLLLWQQRLRAEVEVWKQQGAHSMALGEEAGKRKVCDQCN